MSLISSTKSSFKAGSISAGVLRAEEDLEAGFFALLFGFEVVVGIVNVFLERFEKTCHEAKDHLWESNCSSTTHHLPLSASRNRFRSSRPRLVRALRTYSKAIPSRFT
jgi:hypothetical protein